MYLESDEICKQEEVIEGLTYRKTSFRSKRAFAAEEKAMYHTSVGNRYCVVRNSKGEYFVYIIK